MVKLKDEEFVSEMELKLLRPTSTTLDRDLQQRSMSDIDLGIIVNLVGTVEELVNYNVWDPRVRDVLFRLKVRLEVQLS